MAFVKTTANGKENLQNVLTVLKCDSCTTVCKVQFIQIKCRKGTADSEMHIKSKYLPQLRNSRYGCM